MNSLPAIPLQVQSPHQAVPLRRSDPTESGGQVGGPRQRLRCFSPRALVLSGRLSDVLGNRVGEAVFVPGDPPRRGRLALYSPPTQFGSARRANLELAVRAGSRFHRSVLPVRLLTIAQALELLTLMPADAEVTASLSGWALAFQAGLTLAARGRLLPAMSRLGLDAWRAGPLDVSDEGWLHQLAAAFPPEAHALVIPHSQPLRVRSPESLIRECWDAIADTLPRTKAAPFLMGQSAFAGSRAVRVSNWGEWLEVASQGLREGARPGLRLLLPDGPQEPLQAVLQLRSHADPSLVVDAAELWRAPAPVLRRFGESAEADLLLALRRGARAWPPLQRLIDEARPDRLILVDEEVGELLGPAAEGLAAAGLEVLWPAELSGSLEVRAAVRTPAPAAAGRVTFNLDELLEFRWAVTLDGELLTPSEMEALSEAKRPLVRFRGRWVTLDPELLAQLRRPTPRMRTGEALAAALGDGLIAIDGKPIPIEVQGGLAHLVERLKSAASPHEELEPAGLRGVLRPYQRRGLGWLRDMCDLGLGGCLADDMGLGKTIQVIALHLSRQLGPALVVCPASLLGNWESELGRFAPEIVVRRYHGGGRHLEQLGKTEVVLATYGVVRRDSARLAEVKWDLVVADEAQHVKNPLSSGARELRTIPASVRLALTGTPIENRLSELWSILDWTTPGLLGSLANFQAGVAIPIERHGDQAVRERLARSVRPFLLRRRKVDPDIAPELPPKTETNHLLALTQEQATLYEAVVRETMEVIRHSEGIARRGLVLKLLTALKQVCNHPAQYLHQRGPLKGRSGKLAALDELLEIIIAEGESVLVFTQYVAMARLLESHLTERGVTSLFLHGGVAARGRDRMVAEFQQGVAPVFLLSLKAGGVGLNLTRATHVIHYDRWWNPAVEDQATDRAYRIGQDRPVQVHKLVSQGTLEDRIAELLEQKRALAESVVGAGESWISELSDAQLSELVALRRAG